MEFLIVIGIAIISTIIIWKGCDWLEEYADRLSKFYKLPPIIHGSLVVAVGSSFPELSSTVISTYLHGEFNLGLSAVVGSAIFNILVIPALSGIFSKHPLQADKELVYKDAQFYMLAVAITMITFSFAVIYNPSAEGHVFTGYLNRGLMMIPVGTYLIYLFLQFLEVKEQKSDKEKTKENVFKLWGVLSFSLIMIMAGVEGLVHFCLFLGDYFNTPSFIWGISVMAIVTSLPDAYISIRLARENQGVISLSNVLGSNIFDLLIALPAGVLVAGKTLIDFELAVPLMAALTAATLLLFVFMRYRLYLSKVECWILLIGYAIFITWCFFI